MHDIIDNGQVKWRFKLNLLKWSTIVLPIIFLAALDLVRHTVFAGQLHTFRGFLATYLLIALGVVTFSLGIFGFINRLQARILEQNGQFASLNNIARAAAARPRLDEVLETSLVSILSGMKVESGLICLIDNAKEEHSAICYRGLSADFVRKVQHAKIKDDAIAFEVVRTGKPVIIENVLEDPRVTDSAKQAGIKAIISAPLKSEDEVNGILAIATRKQRIFSDNDRQFLEGIGGQLGMAIRNAQLYEQSELQNRELGALLAVGKAVTGSFDQTEMLNKSLDTIIEVIPVDAAEVWLLDGDDELVMSCHRGAYRSAFLEQTRFRIGEGVPGLAAQSQEPIMVDDLQQDERFLRKEVVKAGFHTLCALPLHYQRKLMGVLVVAAIPAEALRGERKVRLLEGIGEWLAVAIENSRLYQQVQDVAILQERERLAREMHDGMAQLLGYINTQSLAVGKLLADGRIAPAQQELTKMEEITRDLYGDVREGILGLRTTTLSRAGGLLPALREYAERYTEMTDIKVEFSAEDGIEGAHLPTPVEVQLTRIVQEALTNVRKHSKASEVKVTFERNDGCLLVTIADNGQGFELTRLPSTGRPRFGLQTMRERAESLRGSLAIVTAPGSGTRVEVRVPLTPAESQVPSS